MPLVEQVTSIDIVAVVELLDRLSDPRRPFLADAVPAVDHLGLRHDADFRERSDIAPCSVPCPTTSAS